VKEVVEELQQEERKISEKLRGLQGEPDAAHALAALRLLRDHAADLRAVLRDGDPQDQRKVFTRTVRSVTWLPEEAHLEIRLRLPQQENEEKRKPQLAGVTRVDYVRARGGIRTHTSLSGPALLRRIRLPVPATRAPPTPTCARCPHGCTTAAGTSRPTSPGRTRSRR
jgi:hypothetical protein